MKSTFFQRFTNWLKRAALWSVILIFILVITGMIYQTAATEADRKNFPPPGNLIDVAVSRCTSIAKGRETRR